MSSSSSKRLLWSDAFRPLVSYDLSSPRPLVSNTGEMQFSAKGYQITGDFMTSPCCFAGNNDELVVDALSEDNNIYVWSATNGERETLGKQPLKCCVKTVRLSARCVTTSETASWSLAMTAVLSHYGRSTDHHVIICVIKRLISSRCISKL